MRVLCLVLVCAFGICAIQASDIKLTLYYEALCPYSRNFTFKELYPTYEQLGDSVLELELVPYGNAELYNISGQIVVTCQHGELECRGNKVQGCVLELYTQAEAIPFINCDMASDGPGNDDNLQRCAEESNLDWATIEECASGELGDKIVVDNAEKTKSVDPAPAYVPAIAFDGVFDQELSDEAEYALLKTICRLIKNSAPACEQ